jgi:hypothetical protein
MKEEYMWKKAKLVGGQVGGLMTRLAVAPAGRDCVSAGDVGTTTYQVGGSIQYDREFV